MITHLGAQVVLEDGLGVVERAEVQRVVAVTEVPVDLLVGRGKVGEAGGCISGAMDRRVSQ